MKGLCVVAVACSCLAVSAVSGVEELNARFAGKNGVSFRADAHGEPVAVLANAHGSCEVMLRGAQVTACAFAGDAHPLLYVPQMGYVAIPAPRGFIHGGVPLLWPWFGGSGAPQLGAWRRWCNTLFFTSLETCGPFHATARYSLFAVRDVAVAKDETTLVLALGPCEEVAEYTEGVFDLEYRITLGAHKLGLKLTTTNRGEEVFRYREGYHPYFAVSDIYAVTLSGFDGCTYESNRPLPCDETHVWQGKVPEWPGCDLFKFSVDRSVITLEDPGWKRKIVLTTTGARDVVTWGQDVEGASQGLMNILPCECRKYFCIEPSNYYASSEIALKPGESHSFETVITVK